MIWLSFAFVLFRLITASGKDFTALLSWTHPLHTLCTSYFAQANYNRIYQGLICGENALSPTTEVLFKQSGLYHLLIVSGSHFIFLEQILNLFLTKHRKTKFVVFIGFAALCQFNPPVVRALISLILQTLSEHLRLHLRSEQVALLSGLWCLILFPEWFLSHSLILSWLAALALTFSHLSSRQHFLIFIFIYPLFLNNSFYSVINNIVAAPLFSFFLFPMTVITALIPWCKDLGNFLWEQAFVIISYLPYEKDKQVTTLRSLPLYLLWLYLFGLQLVRKWRGPLPRKKAL